MTLTLALLLVAQAQSWQVSLDSLARLGQFSGVVLVAQGGAPQFERAYGMADRESGRANDLETSFNLGSINKLFTGVAIRQLAAAGKLNIDSSLARAWPDYPNQEVARRVTIRQILEHRGGIQGNIFAAPPGKTRHDVVSLQDYFELFKESWRIDRWPANTAIGYTRGAQDADPSTPLKPNTDFLPGKGSSAGGGYSTAHDLLRLVNALRAGKIPAGPPPGVDIAGGAPGLNAAVEGDLRGGYDVIVLANLDPPAAERVAQLIRKALTP